MTGVHELKVFHPWFGLMWDGLVEVKSVFHPTPDLPGLEYGYVAMSVDMVRRSRQGDGS